MSKLFLYLVSQKDNNDYDTYDSFITAAFTEEEARNTLPGNETDWEGFFPLWASSPDKVTVKLIGKADPSIKEGIILESYNAG